MERLFSLLLSRPGALASLCAGMVCLAVAARGRDRPKLSQQPLLLRLWMAGLSAALGGARVKAAGGGGGSCSGGSCSGSRRSSLEGGDSDSALETPSLEQHDGCMVRRAGGGSADDGTGAAACAVGAAPPSPDLIQTLYAYSKLQSSS